MIRDLLYFVGLLIVGYGMAAFYLIRAKSRNALEEVKKQYLEGRISLDDYTKAVQRHDTLRKD